MLPPKTEEHKSEEPFKGLLFRDCGGDIDKVAAVRAEQDRRNLARLYCAIADGVARDLRDAAEGVAPIADPSEHERRVWSRAEILALLAEMPKGGE